ncbi:outer membrane protein [Deinococcus piscis]|uniref:Outer membrane protein n=1 Tax=Deinococcus piscis TaxID=394230 RepID=A0ABQ3K762_9DEIO|nr:MetQ/NlpA family ABC transporter substrate-binding protein [Deinococcus piscis]GHG06766.1 outer membrane protein [Deinococcus piscis]
MRHLSLVTALSLTLLAACDSQTTQTQTTSAATVSTAQTQAASTQTTSAANAQTASGETASAAAPTPASGEAVTLRVGATPVPAGELLEFIKPKLAEQGITLEITEFTDYVTPNTALGEGSLDANLFQHQPYLDSFQADRPLNIVPVRPIYLPALGLYSEKVGALAELPDGATIAVPNDPSNEARALLLLQQGGLITLKPDAGANAGLDAIADNSRGFKFLELEAAQLPRSLADTDASIVNGNYALEVGLNPAKDAILHEEKDSPYVNVLATTQDRQSDPNITRLADALTTPEVRDWLLQKYGGSIIPAF